MSHLSHASSHAPLINPTPRVPVNIRLATDRDDVDLTFVDALHKKNTHGLGFWHLGKLKGAIAQQRMLIAEIAPKGMKEDVWQAATQRGVRGVPVGFAIFTDRYKYREDVACIYAVCVKTVRQRSLIGAALVRDIFNRMPYSVKLCCCWCAQDLDAGYFWENLGFVPLAFRTGARTKGKSTHGTRSGPSGGGGRVHIFWQKRVREGDVSNNTPYWYPSITHGGAIQEGRLVLPIPPGVHWKDPKPMVLPEIPGVEKYRQLSDTRPSNALPDGRGSSEKDRGSSEEDRQAERAKRRELKKRLKLTPEQERKSRQGGLWFETPEQRKAREELEASLEDAKARRKLEKEAAKDDQPKRVYSEAYLRGARDLCAKWLEQLHAAEDGGDHLLAGDSKYNVIQDAAMHEDVMFQLAPADDSMEDYIELRQLPAA